MSESEDRFYVYVYRDLEGVPIYVGKGTGFRWRQHYAITEKSRIARKIRKTRNELGVTLYPARTELFSEKDAFYLEMCLIETFGRLDLGTGTLYNLTDGGEGASGHVRTEESKLKQSLRTTGRKKTEEWKLAQSIRSKGVPQKKTMCPHCNFKGSVSNLARYHFDNCAKKLIAEGRPVPNRSPTLEHRQKISVANKGKPKPVSFSKQLSERQKGRERPKLKCPKCGQIGMCANMKRYHFDNCTKA